MRSHSSSTGIPAQWQNWAGNVTARPRRVASPGTAQEVADEVRRAGADGLTVRMTGTGHSFTPAAVTDGVMLRPGRLTAIRSVDAAAGLVTVEAGCPLQVLNAELLARGLALANMGDIQVQTVAGAIQTGTHGTGRDIGGIAAQVAALEPSSPTAASSPARPIRRLAWPRSPPARAVPACSMPPGSGWARSA